MNRFASWIRSRLGERPSWMNLLLLVALVEALACRPWDLLFTPVDAARDVWLGIALSGWTAKLGDLVHLLAYGAGVVGFWRMQRWVRPWSAVFVGAEAWSALVRPIVETGGFGGWACGLFSGGLLGALALLLWRTREPFRAVPVDYRARYGDWAVVTGASAGIGLEFARALAARGVSCVLAARRADRLEALAEELRSRHGVEARVVEVDLASEYGPDLLADRVADLDVGMVISNAGIGYAGRFDKQDAPRLRQMVALNCTANVTLASRFLPTMVAKGRGAFVITGSVAGRQPVPLHAAYAATKGFELLLGEALWSEVRPFGVDVLVVQPGPVATEFEQVAGEARVDPGMEETAEAVVAQALEALGKQPQVVTGWFNWLRASGIRAFPRTFTALLAHEVMERQVPPAMR